MSRVLISGASGLIGASLIPSLERDCKDIYRLIRRQPRNEREIRWDPMRAIPPQLVSGFDEVVHLSGESVVGRWTDAKKKAIRDSRVITTRNLANALAKAVNPPQTFVCASAIGYYGNRGDEVLTEESASGEGFLAEVSREWEAAAKFASIAGIRTANLRIGVVLSRDGGALKEMLRPFRLGLGGKISSGSQWLSWIHIDDLVAAVLHILWPAESRALSPGPQLSGPVNMVAPNPVTNAEFTKVLAKTLHRPAVLPVPGFALRLAFGEFANEGLLSSARVLPKKLIDHGFAFRYAELRPALADLCDSHGRAVPSAPR